MLFGMLERRWVLSSLLSAAATLSLSRLSEAARPLGLRRPIVIAHRGASSERPEHTLASYARAIEVGADYIEPDLVSTKDGVLVARHENEISGTTDVADRKIFADRRTTKVIDGESFTGWFTEDFTLDELKSLRAKERLPKLRPQNTVYDGQFEVPTFEEVLALAQAATKTEGRSIGVYPETKHPSYHESLGLALEGTLVAALKRAGLNRATAPVFIQSFEVGNLKKMKGMTRVPLIQLLAARGAPADLLAAGDPRSYADLATPEGLAEIARYARGIGPQKSMILPTDAANAWTQPTRLVEDAHAAGLAVHPWTFRSENFFLPEPLRRRTAGVDDASSDAGPGDAGPGDAGLGDAGLGDAAAEIERFLDLGVDGLFADDPGLAAPIVERRFGPRGTRRRKEAPTA
jgi:glycerophosphoryl diester phosphodiesterase